MSLRANELSSMALKRNNIEQSPKSGPYNNLQSNHLAPSSTAEGAYYSDEFKQYTMHTEGLRITSNNQDHHETRSETTSICVARDAEIARSEGGQLSVSAPSALKTEVTASKTGQAFENRHDKPSLRTGNYRRGPAFEGVGNMEGEEDQDEDESEDHDIVDTDDEDGNDDPNADADDDYDAAPSGQSGTSSSQMVAPKPFNKKNLKRHRLSHSETRFLLNEFVNNPHPDSVQRSRLSKQVSGLSSRQIQVWFQNRRAKLKRMSGPDAERLLSSRSYPEGYGPAGFSSSTTTASRDNVSSSPYMQPVEGVYASQISQSQPQSREQIIYSVPRGVPSPVQYGYTNALSDDYESSSPEVTRRKNYTQGPMAYQPVYSTYTGVSQQQEPSQTGPPLPGLAPYSIHANRRQPISFQAHPMGYIRPVLNPLYAPRSTPYNEHDQISALHAHQLYTHQRLSDVRNVEDFQQREQTEPHAQSPNSPYTTNPNHYYSVVPINTHGSNFSEVRRQPDDVMRMQSDVEMQSQIHGNCSPYFVHPGSVPSPSSAGSAPLTNVREQRYTYTNENYNNHVKKEIEKARVEYVREKEMQKQQHEAMQASYQRQQESQTGKVDGY